MNDNVLPDHPAFYRLSDKQRLKLLQAAEIWDAPVGARLYHRGDSGEDLLFLLRGRVEGAGHSESGGNRQPSPTVLLPGDLWGEDRLAHPSPLSESLYAVEESRWLRWSRETLLNLMTATPSMRRALEPVRSRDNRHLSGLASALPILESPGGRRRSFHPSRRPVLPGLVLCLVGAFFLYLAAGETHAFTPLLPMAAVAVYAGWLVYFLVSRLLTVYCIDADSVTTRGFDWNSFSVESQRVSMEGIQGVETEQKGLLKRIIGIGTVTVRASTANTNLVLRDVNHPQGIAQKILNYKKVVSARTQGWDKERMRRALERKGLGESVPVLVHAPSSERDKKYGANGDIRFRRSPAILAGKLAFPMLLAALLFMSLRFSLLRLRPTMVVSVTLILLFWCLYLWEAWRNDQFILSEGNVIDLYKKPLGFMETRRQIELVSVRNIRTEQKGLLAFLFQFGDVILTTSGEGIDSVLAHVSRPWKVQEALSRRREEHIRHVESARREQNNEEITRFAEALDQIRGSRAMEN